MHLLTKSRAVEMQIDAEDFEGATRSYRYSSFTIADEADNYRLNYVSYLGAITECLYSAKGSSFTSMDRDNDQSSTSNCASNYKGGWWHRECHALHLNGVYYGGPHESHADGVNIYCFRGHYYSLKYASIKVRPQ
ncbi:ryncolin-1-like [Oratosquilla oratoria]|uniref:ryncolin-1-like n=1 Tax=Oratosquilla oratoria TaxID=337810 RepID=UPI003F7628A7